VAIDSLVFVSQVTVEVDKILVDSVDELVTFIQTPIQVIIQGFIVVFL
jgi:hypothetical protein